MLLRFYSTGCSRNSRTIPLELPEHIAECDSPMMDWSFTENLMIDDNIAMDVDFAILDDEWAYWCIAQKKIGPNNWSFTFTMCALKTYMMRTGKTTIKGLWNKTPEWIDPDTITPAVSGYKKGRDIALPGLSPFNSLWMEIDVKIPIKNSLGQSHNYNVKMGFFMNFPKLNNGVIDLDYTAVVYNLDKIEYNNNSLTGEASEWLNIDLDKIENISVSRLCPYDYNVIPGSNGSYSYEIVGGNKTITLRYTVRRLDGSGSSNFTSAVLLSNVLDTNKPIAKSGVFNPNLTENEKKYGIISLIGERYPIGSINVNQLPIDYRYVVDNTGWYLELKTKDTLIVIPSNKLPYFSPAWLSYQMREMEYDRAELSRINQYAKDKMYSDVVKGLGNGALAGGFAGTHSIPFGAAMGGISAISSAAGSYFDYRNEIKNNEQAQINKEAMVKKGLDTGYNPGYGYGVIYSEGFTMRLLEPIDDMDSLINIIGYSCTGNIETKIIKGFLQGTPEPSREIVGTVKNLLIAELQSGVWII